MPAASFQSDFIFGRSALASDAEITGIDSGLGRRKSERLDPAMGVRAILLRMSHDQSSIRSVEVAVALQQRVLLGGERRGNCRQRQDRSDSELGEGLHFRLHVSGKNQVLLTVI